MSGGVLERHLDDTPFATGTHKRGAGSATLVDPGADFRSCGVQTSVLIKNTTDGSEGQITAVTEDEITVSLAGGAGNDWDVGDVYEIYITSAEDTFISGVWTDRSKGWRSDREELVDGWRQEDVDLDRHERHVFGPGQPESMKSHRG